MKTEIKVPPMGESISEATIGTILKPSGSQVEADEEILELETDKVNQVLYAPQKGVLQLTVKPEQVVKIGEILGYVEEGSGEFKEAAKPAESGKPLDVEAAAPTLKPASAQQREEKGKKEGREEPSARITKEDYLSEFRSQKQPSEKQEEKKESAEFIVPESRQVSGQRETRKKLSKVRRVIGERLVDVMHTTAMLTTFNEVDMSQIISLREKYKEIFLKEYGVKLGFLSFFVKAVVSALMEFPELNSYIDGEDLVHREYYHIGIAVGTDKGLFVPVVKDCDKLTYAEIEKAIENFALKAREGTIAVDDLKGGGFTITNGGVYGSLLSTPILNPPQCGILGMHKIEKRPIALDDEVVIRPMMYLALSYDHRIVDGKEAVSFLVHIKNHLEDPARQLLEI